jgi:8-oxo-dGTP pyrophosphatase MutT (NUDIX family)
MQNDMQWKLVHSTYLIQDQWATVRADTCQLPNNTIIKPYYVYEFPDWVTAFAITHDGKIIIERQYRQALQQTHFEVPGGCVDKNDPSLEYAIARELREETGYEFEQFIYLGNTSANPSTNNNLMHLYLATGGKKTANTHWDEGENIEVHLMSIEEVIELMNSGQIIQSMHIACITKALQHLGILKYTV